MELQGSKACTANFRKSIEAWDAAIRDARGIPPNRALVDDRRRVPN